jgi:putative spermidine/putrescine transport system permease protein
MGDKRSRSFYVLGAFFIAYVLFLYGPMIAIYILSFQGPDGGLTFPMNGVSLTWFGKVFAGSGIVNIGATFKRSLKLGLVVWGWRCAPRSRAVCARRCRSAVPLILFYTRPPA